MQENDHVEGGLRSASVYQLSSTETLTQVTRYVLGNLHTDLSALALAKEFSLKENTLLDGFESHAGVALDQFILRRRIECALQLLKHRYATDSEIARSFGWGAAQAFKAAFSSYLGITPQGYRRSLFAPQPSGIANGRCRSSKS